MIKKFLPIVFLFAGSQANAAIISGNVTTDAGVAVNLSGMEWMSFDHMDGGTDYTSFGKTVASYSDAGSVWAQNGWELATQQQVTDLYNSLGLTSYRNILNGDGVDFLQQNFGSVTHGAAAHDSSYYSDNAHIRDRSLGVFDSGTVGTLGYLLIESDWEINRVDKDPDDHFDYNFYRIMHDYAYLNESWAADSWPGSEDHIGGFFVRTSSVPEPSIIALFGLGLIGLGFARRRKA